jgi:hypothetical protein
MSAVLYSADHDEIYPFSQKLCFKKSEMKDFTPYNNNVRCNTQSVLLTTSTEAVIYQGNVQTADYVTAEIHQYMTH